MKTPHEFPGRSELARFDRNDSDDRDGPARWQVLYRGFGLAMLISLIWFYPAEAMLPSQAPAIAVAPPSTVNYVPPVDAPVIDPFRPPESFAGPGNRGLEYAVTAGTPISASAEGRVVFAGQVGGNLFVTIAHADGVETTYSYLAEIHVAAGDHVSQGQVIGLSSDVFHFGAKVGEAYLDPASLFAASGPGGAEAVLGPETISAGKAILLPTGG